MIEQKRIGINSRQDQIIDLVRERGFASLEMLADKFGVSQQTIRRDIIYLSEKNLLQRHFGGAGLPAGIDSLAYPKRKVRYAKEKAAIGREIAKKIPNGSSLFIDIGTTMEAVAEALIHHDRLRILTNHIGVVSILCEKTDFEIILPGGLVRNKDRAIAGETTTDFLKSFRVGYGIFGIGTITNDGQLLDYDYRDAQASRAALAISKHKFAAADHSKFNADAMMPFASAAEVDGIFTDSTPPKPIIEALDKAGTRLFVAQK